MTSAAFNARPESSPASQPPAPVRPGVRASLSLDFSRDPRSGRTTLAASSEQPPLRVIRAFTREDGSALAHLHNVSGGLLGGDELHLGVAAGPGSAVQLTTTGATRIYRPRPGSAPAAQLTEIRVAEGAIVEYVPDAIIPFAGARFSQRTRIHLAPGAGLFWWEILAPGREARGELFHYERVEMRAEIFAAGKPIAAEAFVIEPRRGSPQSVARFGPFRYSASFYICLPAVAGLPPSGGHPALPPTGGLPPLGGRVGLPPEEGHADLPPIGGSHLRTESAASPPKAGLPPPGGRADVTPISWATAEAHLRTAAAALASPDMLWGVSTLSSDGLTSPPGWVVRCLAREGHAILPGLQTMWRAAKLHLFSRPPILPRKVH